MSTRTPVAGEWYLDITNGRIYVVAFIQGLYILVNIHSGIPFGHGSFNAPDIFLGDSKDFTKVEKRL